MHSGSLTEFAKYVFQTCYGSCCTVEASAVNCSSVACASMCSCVFPQVMEAVETAFVERFGPYAGWAHNTLFIAELASQQVQSCSCAQLNG